MRLFGKSANRVDVLAKRAWRLSWGLVFVWMMTMLSERIPQVGCARDLSPISRQSSQQIVHHLIK
jgi:hypothetical protein